MIVEFNAWHPASLQMFFWKDLKLIGSDNTVEHNVEGIFTTELNDPNHVILLPYTQANDYNENKLFLGDLIKNNNYVYKISLNFSGGFYGICNDGDKYGSYTIGLINNTTYSIKNNKILKIGSIYENPKLFKL